jgi:GNAT superfamily N-acetyltransferase
LPSRSTGPVDASLIVRREAQDATVIREVIPPDTDSVFRAMQALRADLHDEESFVCAVDDVQRAEGYRLIGAFENGEPEAVAVAGFRTGHSFAWGHYLYVDDLSTLPEARRRGHGRALLEWLLGEGRRLGCDQLHLDSGVGLDRADAHRLYLNAGMVIASHHFAGYVKQQSADVPRA